MKFRLSFVALIYAVYLMICCDPASADFTPITQPDASYLKSTFKLPITDPDGTYDASLTDGKAVVVTLSSYMKAQTVPDTWKTWSPPPATESSTPRVLWTVFGTSETLTLSSPAK